MDNQLQKGQVILVVVLVMVVALTVGLSVASRSITNLRTTVDDENSQRAFSAAEAGVERAVKGNCANDLGCTISQGFSEGFTENNSSYETKVVPIKGTQFLVKGGTQIKQDEGADVWLSQYSTDPLELYSTPRSGIVTVYWGDTSGGCLNAAMQVMVLEGSKTSPTLTQYAYDPCSTRRATNQFSTPTITNPSMIPTIDGYKAGYGFHIQVTNGLLMRVIPLYTNTTIAMTGDITFPIQGQQITSTGVSGETVRKVTFTQSFASIPSEFFQYALISQ